MAEATPHCFMIGDGFYSSNPSAALAPTPETPTVIGQKAYWGYGATIDLGEARSRRDQEGKTPAQRKRRSITGTRRQRVFDRDGHRCAHCGATHMLVIDHIRPLAQGGDNSECNLQALCWSCNAHKGGNMPLRDWDRERSMQAVGL